jgi:hypothetical protein
MSNIQYSVHPQAAEFLQEYYSHLEHEEKERELGNCKHLLCGPSIHTLTGAALSHGDKATRRDGDRPALPGIFREGDPETGPSSS